MLSNFESSILFVPWCFNDTVVSSHFVYLECVQSFHLSDSRCHWWQASKEDRNFISIRLIIRSWLWRTPELHHMLYLIAGMEVSPNRAIFLHIDGLSPWSIFLRKLGGVSCRYFKNLSDGVGCWDRSYWVPIHYNSCHASRSIYSWKLKLTKVEWSRKYVHASNGRKVSLLPNSVLAKFNHFLGERILRKCSDIWRDKAVYIYNDFRCYTYDSRNEGKLQSSFL